MAHIYAKMSEKVRDVKLDVNSDRLWKYKLSCYGFLGNICVYGAITIRVFAHTTQAHVGVVFVCHSCVCVCQLVE